MKRASLLLAGFNVLAMVFAPLVSATPWYVTTNGTGAGTSWTDALGDIQSAISKAVNVGDVVWVSNGVYATGGMTNWPSGYSLTNRVVITNAITVRSAHNDPTNTIIKGTWDSAINGPAAVRCVYMVNNSTLIGFTLTNGDTMVTGNGVNDRVGGGVKAESTSAVVSNCVITGNAAYTQGGGAHNATLHNCKVIGNCTTAQRVTNGGGAQSCILYDCIVKWNFSGNGGAGLRACTAYNCTIVSNDTGGTGGGAFASTLYNCLLSGNLANTGGGARESALYNCTIVSNQATGDGGGGVYSGALYNCIAYFNTANAGVNWLNLAAATNSCTIPAISGVMNITDNPLFVDPNTGNWRLSPNSTCINTGTNFDWTLDPANARSKDLDGRMRVRYGTVDMGAYEKLYSGTMIKLR